MWDIHFETWTDTAVVQGLNFRHTDFPTARQHVTDGLATGFPAGAPFGPSGLIVNCPWSASTSTSADKEHNFPGAAARNRAAAPGS